LSSPKAGDGSGNQLPDQPWKPSQDKSIPCSYNTENFDQGKSANKKALLKRLGLPQGTGLPLVVVTPPGSGLHRETMINAGAELPSLPAMFVFLQTGDAELDRMMQNITDLHPDHIAVAPSACDEFKHLVIAGSDMMLMAHPCEQLGFSQTDSMLYGTIPIVGRGEGNIMPLDHLIPDKGKSSGLSFGSGDPQKMIHALKDALELYQDRKVWLELQKRALCADFHWIASACKLVELYQSTFQHAPIHP
jgi:starch synthase